MPCKIGAIDARALGDESNGERRLLLAEPMIATDGLVHVRSGPVGSCKDDSIRLGKVQRRPHLRIGTDEDTNRL